MLRNLYVTQFICYVIVILRYLILRNRYNNVIFKFIIQLMSAAISKRDLIYFTFHDHKLKAELDAIYSHLNQKTIGQIFDLLSDYEPETCSLFEFVTRING